MLAVNCAKAAEAEITRIENNQIERRVSMLRGMDSSTKCLA
jgi:hypothetical protein